MMFTDRSPHTMNFGFLAVFVALVTFQVTFAMIFDRADRGKHASKEAFVSTNAKDDGHQDLQKANETLSNAAVHRNQADLPVKELKEVASPAVLVRLNEKLTN